MNRDLLFEHIASSPLVRAAITEAVHRFYYNRVLSDKEKDKKELEQTGAADVLSNLWNTQPNWRHVIEKSGQKFAGSENVNSVSVYGKPKKLLTMTVTFHIHEENE